MVSSLEMLAMLILWKVVGWALAAGTPGPASALVDGVTALSLAATGSR